MKRTDRPRAFEALSNPKTAADYAMSMPLKDYLVESRKRGVPLPAWLPAELTETARERRARTANERRVLKTMGALGAAAAQGRDEMILAVLQERKPTP